MRENKETPVSILISIGCLIFVICTIFWVSIIDSSVTKIQEQLKNVPTRVCHEEDARVNMTLDSLRYYYGTNHYYLQKDDYISCNDNGCELRTRKEVCEIK